MPIRGKYSYDRWLFKVTVPRIEIDGPNGPSGATGSVSKIIIE